MARKFADEDFICRLAEADKLFAEPECKIIKDQKKIKVGRITVRIAGAPHSLYLKRYNSFSLARKLISPLLESGAARALRGAAILREAEIPAADPIAAVLSLRRGAGSHSFFISEEISGGKTADAFWREELAPYRGKHGLLLRRRFLAELAALFQAMHARGIYHNDLKDANIVAVGAQNEHRMGLYLLDFEGVKRYRRLSRKRIVKNLMQINRTLGRYLQRTDKLFFFKCYLGGLFSEAETKRRLIQTILNESRRLDERKRRNPSTSTAPKRVGLD